MNKYLRLMCTPIILALALIACGGNDAVHPPGVALQRAMLYPSDRVVDPEPNYPLSAGTYHDASVAVNVAKQAALPGNVILTTHGYDYTLPGQFALFTAYVDEAVNNYPGKFTHVYLFDEFKTADSAKWPAIQLAIAYTHSKGLKTVMSYLTHSVILDTWDPVYFTGIDLIGLDPYPAALPTVFPGDFVYTDNRVYDLLKYMIAKVDASGTTAEIWYLYQAFFLNTTDSATITQDFILQRDVLEAASGLGVDGIMPWGFYLGITEMTAEPITEGVNSPYEALLRY